MDTGEQNEKTTPGKVAQTPTTKGRVLLIVLTASGVAAVGMGLMIAGWGLSETEHRAWRVGFGLAFAFCGVVALRGDWRIQRRD